MFPRFSDDKSDRFLMDNSNRSTMSMASSGGDHGQQEMIHLINSVFGNPLDSTTSTNLNDSDTPGATSMNDSENRSSNVLRPIRGNFFTPMTPVQRSPIRSSNPMDMSPPIYPHRHYDMPFNRPFQPPSTMPIPIQNSNSSYYNQYEEGGDARSIGSAMCENSMWSPPPSSNGSPTAGNFGGIDEMNKNRFYEEMNNLSMSDYRQRQAPVNNFQSNPSLFLPPSTHPPNYPYTARRSESQMNFYPPPPPPIPPPMNRYRFPPGMPPYNRMPLTPGELAYHNQFDIDLAARMAMNAARICEPTCTWSGQLPAKELQDFGTYSCKVFVGGVPWDVTEEILKDAFGKFGPCRVEWPGKEARYVKSVMKPSTKGKGYVYMIYEKDKSVKELLRACIRETSGDGEWYLELTTHRVRTEEIRQVQIIPWNIGDSTYIPCPSQRLDPKKTIFVGALHGLITAEVLGKVMNDLFGGVVFASIDLDKFKYPIGSGRVTFNSHRSFFKALTAAFVEIKSSKFSKKVQIDPFLEEAMCSNCYGAPGPYFCREFMCFRYFCKSCWMTQHALNILQSHQPLMRNATRRYAQQSTASINVGASHH